MHGNNANLLIPGEVECDPHTDDVLDSVKGLPTLLIVDDEQGILETYKHYLNPGNAPGVVQSARHPIQPTLAETSPEFRILTAHTGEEAVELVQTERDRGRYIQAGFFDMKMPGGIDGLETIRRIRHIDAGIHFVIVTAYQDRLLEEIGKVFGPESNDQWEYLNKPFTDKEIIQKARNAVAFWKRRYHHDVLLQAMEESSKRYKRYFEKHMRTLALENQLLKEKNLQLERELKKKPSHES